MSTKKPMPQAVQEESTDDMNSPGEHDVQVLSSPEQVAQFELQL